MGLDGESRKFTDLQMRWTDGASWEGIQSTLDSILVSWVEEDNLQTHAKFWSWLWL